MGYAYYDCIPSIDGKPMKRGYAVSCKCHQRKCKEKVDRGFAYLCYRCLWYFCTSHLFWGNKVNECFAGASHWVCEKCYTEQDLEPDENEEEMTDRNFLNEVEFTSKEDRLKFVTDLLEKENGSFSAGKWLKSWISVAG